MNRPTPARIHMRRYLWPAVLLTIIAVVLGAWFTWGHYYPRGPRLIQVPGDSSALGGASDAEKAGAVTGDPHTPSAPEATWEVATRLVHSPRTLKEDALTGTAYGPVALVVASTPQPESSASRSPSPKDEEPSTALISLDPETGAVRWYRDISPIDNDDHDFWSADSVFSPYNPPPRMLASSPDGEYVAFSLLPVPDGPGLGISPESDPRAWINGVAVVSARTGELVRIVQTKESVLGQALTNDALVVQTSTALRPSGGSISTYSLSNPGEAPSTWDSTGWLVGATSRGVVQSSVNPSDRCFDMSCSPGIVTISDPATGTVTETYTGVRWVLPRGGGLVRDVDSQGVPLASPSDDAAGSELVDLESGATLSTSGHGITRVVTTTGTAWVLGTARDDEAGTPAHYVGWTPVGGSEGLRQEPLDVIEIESADDQSDSHSLRRTTLTMEGAG